MLLGLVFVCLLGLAVGSFLNVVIWRVPRGESVVVPASRCPACDHDIRVRDNVPVLGWLLLAGRCRDCDAPVSARYPLVEAATAALFVVTAVRIGFGWDLAAFLYLAAVGLALSLIDVDVKRLPNSIVLPSYPVAGLLLASAAALDGSWQPLLRAVLAAALLFGGYFAVAVIVPGGMGFGDVKLAGILGLYLGWLGWPEVVMGTFLGFLYGGLLGSGLMLVQRAGRKTKIPFGPFMVTGALTAVFLGDRVWDAYLGLFS